VEHSECRHRDISARPSRLIRIVSSRESTVLRLVESSEQTELPTYAALSHCWGNLQPLRTTRDNFGQHKAGIHFSALPKTFQDAVIVTKYFGFEHLWIDSLCIIQDIPTDWEYECSRMAGIYSNSELTIAAGDAANGSIGFLRNYDTPKRSCCSLELQDLPGHEEEGIIVEHVDYVPNRITRSSSDHPSRLSSRGWALQEQMLSNNVLTFRNGHMDWDCRRFTRTDDCHYPSTEIRGHYLSINNVVKRSLRDCAGDTEIYNFWLEVVETYSSRELSHATDRLPALSGMAQAFSLALSEKDDYMAGLWRRNLAGGLTWKPDSRGREDGDALVKLASDQTAPSWSWASQSGPISFGILDSVRGVGPYRTELIVNSVQVSPSGLDLFGRVSGGTITVTGQLTEILLRPAPEWMHPGTFQVARVPPTHLEANATLDCRPSNLPNRKASTRKEVYALLVVSDLESDWSDESSATTIWEWFGLALEKVESKSDRDVFRRIGIIHGQRVDGMVKEEGNPNVSRFIKTPIEDYFEDCKRTVLDII
jgi:hypothetical protein